MVALPGDRAIAAYRDVGDKMNVAYTDGYDRYVTMIDSSGKATGKPYSCYSDIWVTGLIYYQPWVYIIQKDGTITKIRENLHPDTASVVRVPVMSYGDIYPGDVIQEDVILLTDRNVRTVFTYNMKTKKKKSR